jgi:hypothetical protein
MQYGIMFRDPSFDNSKRMLRGSMRTITQWAKMTIGGNPGLYHELYASSILCSQGNDHCAGFQSLRANLSLSAGQNLLEYSHKCYQHSYKRRRTESRYCCSMKISLELQWLTSTRQSLTHSTSTFWKPQQDFNINLRDRQQVASICFN